MAKSTQSNPDAASFAQAMQVLVARRLGDPRRPDIVGLVEDLLQVASRHGSLGGVVIADNCLRFLANGEPAYELVSATARTTARMIAARLGVLCKPFSPDDVSVYGGSSQIHNSRHGGAWNVCVRNTPERQEFLVECLPSGAG